MLHYFSRYFTPLVVIMLFVLNTPQFFTLRIKDFCATATTFFSLAA